MIFLDICRVRHTFRSSPSSINVKSSTFYLLEHFVEHTRRRSVLIATMYFARTISSAVLLVAVTLAQDQTLSGISGSNENGVATYDGYTCSGAIYVGCDNAVANAFCCVGAHAQQNICNSPQPTTCPQGSYVPLTAAGSVSASATVNASPGSTSAHTSASLASSSSGSTSGTSPTATADSASSTTSSGHSTGAAATASLLSPQAAAGLLAVVVKVLFL